MNYAPYEKTPISAAGSIRDYVVGQVVYDLGGGDGQFAAALKLEGAKDVVVIENDPLLAAQARKIVDKVVIDDFDNVDFSSAQLLFIFMSFYGTMMLTKKLRKDDWHGTVISHYYPLHFHPADFQKPDEFINEEVPFLIYHL